jgi:hypothetical protein
MFPENNPATPPMAGAKPEMTFHVTRAHLRNACVTRNADLLDRLLEIDASKIDDKQLFTDDWGSWWGLLVEAICASWTDGVKVLLKYNANRHAETWGDGQIISALEHAAGQPEILALLQNPNRPEFQRGSNPPLPEDCTAEDAAVNRQGEVADRTGLVFQVRKP